MLVVLAVLLVVRVGAVTLHVNHSTAHFDRVFPGIEYVALLVICNAGLLRDVDDLGVLRFRLRNRHLGQVYQMTLLLSGGIPLIVIVLLLLLIWG